MLIQPTQKAARLISGDKNLVRKIEMHENIKDVLLDVPSNDLLFGFEELKNAVVNLFADRKPQFTVGILGEWGAGKTTLSKSIYQDIKSRTEKNINKNTLNTLQIPVWFDAWRYEHEDNIIIPLFFQIRKVLLETLERLPDSKDIDGFKAKFDKTISALIYGVSAKLSLGIADISFSAKDTINRERELKEKDLFALGEIQSVYFDVIEKLTEITSIKRANSEIKIEYFIFIDDLDRCFPDKALNLLEHLKTIFDIDGFVFVLSLDTRATKTWIRSKHGNNAFISEKDYIEKLIQIPVVLPKVNPSNFIDDFIMDRSKLPMLSENVVQTLKNLNKHLPNNPRSLKRIINDYLIVHGDDIDANITFKMLILKHRWEKCYNDIMRFGEDLFQEVLRFCKENKYERDRILFCLRNKNYPSGFSFNEFKETLNEQTKFESEFEYFEYFKDYVFDVAFKQYISIFNGNEVSMFIQKHYYTCILNYVETSSNRYAP